MSIFGAATATPADTHVTIADSMSESDLSDGFDEEYDDEETSPIVETPNSAGDSTTNTKDDTRQGPLVKKVGGKSKVWDHFRVYKFTPHTWAVCDHCKQELRIDKKGSTTNLNNHFKAKHKEMHKKHVQEESKNEKKKLGLQQYVRVNTATVILN